MLKRMEDMAKEIRERMRGGNGTIQLQHIFTQDELSGKCRLFARVTLEPGSSIEPTAMTGRKKSTISSAAVEPWTIMAMSRPFAPAML